ncbi:MAG TPA: 16S rRNA (adenine(1518)-N(6)/adenine(1519)-N(6))-dimethyltransferase RsmA [Solirubrobacteraceae bacterium]|nr:16S rRNA (adenine(1518)-N(6)/adenine(1519)-N(6))-dimethyltransferase RsmA [Solirubrobacteraceae bacterium]
MSDPVTVRRTGPRSLGQNFLVDRNILDVIERLAELSDQDVALEVGAGQGALSTRLAAAARFIHIVELDRSLEEGLRAQLEPFANFELHMADALTLELTELSPPPDKMVANLPYSVAATVILRTIEELPSLRSWVVMVQREVGERFAARPGTRTYGVPSVLAQLACEVKVLRPVGRGVFRPVPNVDSVLLGLLRRGEPKVTTAVNPLVHDAFAHRRKALAGSLALKRRTDPGIRERARQALQDLGLPPDVRAEKLSPEQFIQLADKLRS